ncbi:Vascular endothelial growth factor receptor 1, partial [Stegodyphus mimosarum]
MLKEQADVNQLKALMAELKILIQLGHHVNIVNLMGAVTKNIAEGEVYVIVEYCRYGNLRNYLLRHRDKFINELDELTGKVIPTMIDYITDNLELVECEVKFDPARSSAVFAVDNPSYRPKVYKVSSYDSKVSSSGRTASCSTTCSSGSSTAFRNYDRIDSHDHAITTSDLLCYAFQCARGMDYLASRKLIHRDLAARNVLLADDKIVKICDFGLAKDCYKYENYIKKGDGPLPIKWMAIESIWDHIFTTKS